MDITTDTELVPGLMPYIAAQLGVGVVPAGDLDGQAMPAVTYMDVGARSEPTFDSLGFQWLRVQFDCYGNTQGSANGVRKALRLLLDGFRGQLASGIYLEDVEFISQQSMPQEGVRQYRAMIEFYFKFNLPDNFTITPPPPVTVTDPGVVAAEGISALQCVSSTAGGVVVASSSDVTRVAIAIAATGAAQGAELVLQTGGELQNSGWNWVEGSPVFVGANGMLTQTAPSSGYIQTVATVLNATTLLIEIQEPTFIQ